MQDIYRDPLGNEYYVVTGRFLNSLFQGMSNARQLDPNEKIYLPKPPEDDFKNFPEYSSLEDYGLFFRSGIVIHKVDFLSLEKAMENGITARDLEILGEDWDGECYQVLEAHGWLTGIRISEFLINNVVENYGACEITRAKIQFGKNWECRVTELAATKLTPPFSRLWYVANMQALYYCHRDDFRHGFLWSEYKQRMLVERSFNRGRKTGEAASKGGQTKARESIEMRQTVIGLMERYVSDGHSISRSAELTARAGIGTSKGANKKIWERYR